MAVSVLLYRCTTWMLAKCIEKKLDGNYTMIQIFKTNPGSNSPQNNSSITKGHVILPFSQNGSWGCRVLLPLVILKGRKNELTKILIVFNLKVLLTAWDERNLCGVSRRKKKTVVELRRNKDAEVKAGAEMLSSGQELKCWCQSGSWKYPICFSEDPLV